MQRCWLWIGLVVALLLSPLQFGSLCARAQTSEQANEDLARARFLEGRAAYDARDYVRAYEQFQASYSMSKQPKLLYNLGLSAQKLGKLSEAVQYFESYLAWGEGDRSEEVRGRLAALRDMVAQQSTAPASVAPPAVTEPVAAAAVAVAEPVAPATVPALAPAPSASETAASASAAPEPAIALNSSSPAKDAVPAARPYWKRAWFWTVIGVVVAGAVTTGVLLSLDRDPKQATADEHIMTLRMR